MDLGYLLRILNRRKWVIAAAMLAAMFATFYLVGLKPERYKASAIMATGIVNYKGINSDGTDAFVQQFQIENAFANLTEFVLSRASLKILTMEMLKHDMNATKNGTNKAFKRPDKKLIDYSDAEGEKLLQYLNQIDLDSIIDPAFGQEFDYLLDKISRSYGYDHDQLLKSIAVKRKGTTDYLTLEMTTTNPVQSQHMANTFVNRFRIFYQNLALREKRQNVEAFAQLAAEKKWVVDSTQAKLFGYLQSRGIPVLGEQSKELVSELSSLEQARTRAMSKQSAASKSIAVLDTAIQSHSKTDSRETRNRITDKYLTDESLDRVRKLKQRSIETGGKDEEVEAELAEAERDLRRSIERGARNIGKVKEADESKRTREELTKTKVETKLDRIEAEESLEDIDKRIYAIRGMLSKNVAYDEISTKLRDDQNRALLEFDKVNEQLIRAKLELENYENRLTVVETAQLPEWPEPNRRVLLSVFASIVVGTLSVIAIFLLAYFDNTLQTADLFKKFSGDLPLLGTVANIPLKNLNLNVVFSTNGEMPQYTHFREGLRKIRSQIVHSNRHIFLVVSTKNREGKTFAMHGIAYSLAANRKRVLMLDTNFKTPLPESYIHQPSTMADFLNKTIRENGLESVFETKDLGGTDQYVDIVGNTGLHKSPAELLEPERFRKFLDDLRSQYDYIFMESAALNTYSDAQELLPFSDAVIAVFNANSSLVGADHESLRYLKGLGDKFAGAILTGVEDR